MTTATDANRLLKTLTIYGRKPVLEALQNPQLDCAVLHTANSNKPAGIIRDILATAQQRGVDIREHDRDRLSRISRNRKQDQGVALDITCPAFTRIDLLSPESYSPSTRFLALDGITNPQNVGMILRSAIAGGIDGIVYPRQGVAAMGPLVIKASAGTLFRAPIVQCEALPEALSALRGMGFTAASLEGGAKTSLFEYVPESPTVFVLGGESDGVSPAVVDLCDQRLRIPMAAGVESLNVAVAASLVAFAPSLQRPH